ncbi:MAG: histidine kinase [Opitutaceae bacterium]
MPLKYRFIILFGLLCVGLGSGVGALYFYERQESALILENIRKQRTNLTEQVLEMLSSPVEKFVYEYAQWTEMVDFVQGAEPDLVWAEINLLSASEVYETEDVWVFRLDGSLFYSHDFDATESTGPKPPAPEVLLRKLREEKLVHFFEIIDGDLYEIRGAPITHSIGWDETDEVYGYLAVGRKWDAALISKLSRILSSTVSIDQTGHTHTVMNEHLFRIHLHRELPGLDGKPISSLDITYVSPELRQISDTDWWEAMIFVIYGGLAIGAVMFFSHRWVLQPLSRISNSLSTKDTAPLERMLVEKSELGRVANLIKSAFQDREDLKAAMDERARLGRDLHDGVIQTLYASGMSLASIQANVGKDPEQAIALLEQTRRELNATIKDVRNFITRLEPESEQTQKFETALRTLLDFMRGGLAVECTLDIDPDIDTDLPMDIRAHLLQIVREAGSNAIRHGDCTRFHVSLHKSPAGELDFTATDNGSGFDPAKVRTPGHGLQNFRDRATDLCAKLDIESAPGNGAIIRLRIPV